MLERAASLVILLLLAHSLVDYPLRTAALSAIFAFFCAVLGAPAAEPQLSLRSREHRRPARARQAAALPFKNWTPDADWPQSWKGR